MTVLAVVAMSPLTTVSAAAAEPDYFDRESRRVIDGDIDPQYRGGDGRRSLPSAGRYTYDRIPARGSLKDDIVDPPPVYSKPRYDRFETAVPRCVHPRDIKRGLRHDGWRDFDDFDVAGDFIYLTAERRAYDRDYDLKLDRCSGAILKLRPSDDDHDDRYDGGEIYDHARLPYRDRGRFHGRPWR